jgi:predicted O-methyltransferase YrrM
MNSVLKQILDTGIVSDGTKTARLHSNMQRDEGELIQQLIANVKPSMTLETGMAYGVSTLYVCEALSRLPQPTRHIAVDPVQSTGWQGLGRYNIRQAGYEAMVQVIEEGSEIALPRLLAGGTRIQFAIIDGWHTFDHALIDFFYINRMLSVGGVVLLDDVSYESIHKLVRYILNYPAYRMMGVAGTAQGTPSVLGRLRRGFSNTKMARTFLREDLLNRPWDRGWGSCVALQKTAPDERSFDWYIDF